MFAERILLAHEDDLDPRAFTDLCGIAGHAVQATAKYIKRGFLSTIPLEDGVTIIGIRTFDGEFKVPQAVAELQQWLPKTEVIDILRDAMIAVDSNIVEVQNDDPFA